MIDKLNNYSLKMYILYVVSKQNMEINLCGKVKLESSNKEIKSLDVDKCVITAEEKYSSFIAHDR